MRATMLYSYGDREKAVVPDMEAHHAVFFINSFRNFYMLVDNPRGDAVREWLKGNIPGKYSVRSSYVFFEDYDDALLCYLRYKG